jgi:hypothetical protein
MPPNNSTTRYSHLLLLMGSACLLQSCAPTSSSLHPALEADFSVSGQKQLLLQLRDIESEVDAQLDWPHVNDTWDWALDQAKQAYAACHQATDQTAQCQESNTWTERPGDPTLGLPATIEFSKTSPTRFDSPVVLTLSTRGQLLRVAGRLPDSTEFEILSTVTDGWFAYKWSPTTAAMGLRSTPTSPTSDGAIGTFSDDRSVISIARAFYRDTDGTGGVASWQHWDGSLPAHGSQTRWKSGIVYEHLSVHADIWDGYWLSDSRSGRFEHHLTKITTGRLADPTPVRSGLSLPGYRNCQIALWLGSDFQRSCPSEAYFVDPDAL